MKRSAIKRGGRSRNAIRAAQAKADRTLQRELAKCWRLATIRTGCVMCRAFPVRAEVRRARGPELRRMQAHHVVPQRHLKRYGHELYLWDQRNGLCLCEYHHARHENFTQRVPRVLLPTAVVAFVADLQLEWLLDAEYPPAGPPYTDPGDCR